MKAIIEYNVKENNNLKGRVCFYTKNNSKVNKVSIATKRLEGYQNQKQKEYSLWDKYDYYIQNILKDYNIEDDILEELTNLKKEYDDMKESRSFYTGEDFDNIISQINDNYETLIKDLEIRTNTKFGLIYNLQ